MPPYGGSCWGPAVRWQSPGSLARAPSTYGPPSPCGSRELAGWPVAEKRGSALCRHPFLDRRAATDGRAHPTMQVMLLYCPLGVKMEFRLLWNFKGK